ncbi:MAG: hypothetical protein HZB46_07525 [Solirubrobacterales bacterium]|nr:hypothetical protein [Solirubrobacterales bacterium]
MAAEDDDLPVDLVATAGPLDPVIVTLRDVLHRSGALRVAAVVDLGAAGASDPDAAAVVDVGRLLPVEVQVGDRKVHLPHALELDARPLGHVDVRQLPPFEVDPSSGEVVGTIGGLQHLGEAARELVALLGGRSVALLQVPTTTPDLPLTLTARIGEPVLVAIGEEEFELPEPGAG